MTILGNIQMIICTPNETLHKLEQMRKQTPALLVHHLGVIKPLPVVAFESRQTGAANEYKIVCPRPGLATVK